VVQGLPFLAGAALFALWLWASEPPLAAIFVGMFIAWLLSVILQVFWGPWRWRVLHTGPVQVLVDDVGITWSAPHGSRFLRWEALSVSRLGNTWVVSVHGHEAAYIPARCLDATEAAVLERRMRTDGPHRT
jgi:hypothetical protein